MGWLARTVIIAITDELVRKLLRIFALAHLQADWLVSQSDVERNQRVGLILIAVRLGRKSPDFLFVFQLLLEFRVRLHDEAVAVLNRLLHGLLLLREIHGRVDQVLQVGVGLGLHTRKVVVLRRSGRVVLLRVGCMRPRVLLHLVHRVLLRIAVKVFFGLLIRIELLRVVVFIRISLPIVFPFFFLRATLIVPVSLALVVLLILLVLLIVVTVVRAFTLLMLPIVVLVSLVLVMPIGFLSIWPILQKSTLVVVLVFSGFLKLVVWVILVMLR